MFFSRLISTAERCLPVPVAAYDKEDPPMGVGSIYLKFPTCMSLDLLYLSTLYFKCEFEFNVKEER
jgi:hypothetical protein